MLRGALLFLLGLVAGVAISAGLFFWFAAGPLKAAMALDSMRKSFALGTGESGPVWKVEQAHDAISREPRWIFYGYPDGIGLRGTFALRCEKGGRGRGEVFSYMLAKIDGLSAAYSEGKSITVTRRVGDFPVRTRVWTTSGKGFILSVDDVPEVLEQILSSDSLALRANADEPETYDFEISLEGAAALVDDFKRGCASIAATAQN